MLKLKKTSQIVLKVLREDIESRKDDMRLFLQVHELLYPGIKNMPMKDVLELIRLGELPSWGSMSRARRKIQEKHPELKDMSTAFYREIEQEKYLEYVRC